MGFLTIRHTLYALLFTTNIDSPAYWSRGGNMAHTLLSIPADSVPQFDELYVISDLHLGGPSDFQIFNSGAELKRLIDYLCTISPDSKIALLINGDFVD